VRAPEASRKGAQRTGRSQRPSGRSQRRAGEVGRDGNVSEKVRGQPDGGDRRCRRGGTVAAGRKAAGGGTTGVGGEGVEGIQRARPRGMSVGGQRLDRVDGGAREADGRESRSGRRGEQARGARVRAAREDRRAATVLLGRR